jgi:predicted MFS family arabinose efflux permease
MSHSFATTTHPALGAADRARGRGLAIASHPFGMTFRTVFTTPLPTLALLALGASESVVGLQSALVSASVALQLPALRMVARISKRRILVGGHSFGLLGALPLVAFGGFAALGEGVSVVAAMACFAAAAAGIAASDTVWFPMLRAYVEPGRIGRFFGLLRSGWHLTLIVYFLGSTAWLSAHPGSFGPLFAVGAACGLLRIALISRLPERSEQSDQPIQIRQVVALLRDRQLRRYLLGVSCSAGARTATLPFVVVMLRRELGFSSAEVVYTAVATYAGGLVSLYLWGRAVDRFGSLPIFAGTSLSMGILVLGLIAASGPGANALPLAIGFFFVYALISAGFGVADTLVLFGLTPASAPSRSLVLAAVVVGISAALAPALSGWALEWGLAASEDRLGVYRAFLAVMALLHAVAWLPLRRIAGDAAEPIGSSS